MPRRYDNLGRGAISQPSTPVSMHHRCVRNMQIETDFGLRCDGAQRWYPPKRNRRRYETALLLKTTERPRNRAITGCWGMISPMSHRERYALRARAKGSAAAVIGAGRGRHFHENDCASWMKTAVHFR